VWYQWLHSDHRAAQERGARTSSTISTADAADAVGMLAAAVAPAAAAEALSGAAVGSAAAPELADAGALVREQAHTVAAAAAAAAVAPAARCSFISSSPEKKCRKCTMAKNHILTYTYILMSIFLESFL
jgi:membrane protease subunit (stomatin/prohibitin family)